MHRSFLSPLLHRFFVLVLLALALPAQALTLAPHPRLLLDAATLANLRSKAAAHSSDWLKLKEQCDAYLGGTVKLPNPPDTSSDPPKVGSGYEGEEYPPVLLAEALCYQTLRNSDPATAQTYASKAVQILIAMATPPGQTGAADPCEDTGYVQRNYSLAYGFGYDWLFDALTVAQRTQVYTTAKAWIHSYETDDCSHTTYIHPLSNYFAGFFHADTAVALAMYDEDPGNSLWLDWLNTQFNTATNHPPHVGVAPYFAQNMKGGGWPEGFGSYGPAAVFHMALPALEVRTATNGSLDLVNGASGYRYPIEIADYLLHFTWPSRGYIDDRDTNHANGDPSSPPGTLDGDMLVDVLGQLRAWGAANADVFQQFLNEASAATSYDPYGRLGQVPSRWKTFLFTNPLITTQPLATLPRAYFAPGMNSLAARSDWSTTASWMSFRAGPYVEDQNHAEEYFDQGGLALARGATPFLINGTGWIVHEPNGNRDEYPVDFGCDRASDNSIYCDMFGGLVPGDPWIGNRSMANVFFVRNMNGQNLVESFGQNNRGPLDTPPPRTKVSHVEDGGAYVYALGEHLEDMYDAFSQGPGVAAWSRQIVYLRPNRVVVYDRTGSGKAAYDQYLAYHFPAAPVTATAPAGQTRLDVTYQGTFAGSMTVVAPANAVVAAPISMYPTTGHGKVWQTQVRPASSATAQQWITVFDMASSAAAVATATPIAVSQGGALGTLLSDAGGDTAVLSGTGAAGTPISGALVYTTPKADTTHIVTELAPHAHYSVVATLGSGAQVTVTPAAQGALVASAQGVLAFKVSAAGVVGALDGIFADGFGN